MNSSILIPAKATRPCAIPKIYKLTSHWLWVLAVARIGFLYNSFTPVFIKKVINHKESSGHLSDIGSSINQIYFKRYFLLASASSAVPSPFVYLQFAEQGYYLSKQHIAELEINFLKLKPKE